MIFAFSVVDYNHHNVALKRWNNSCLSNSKSQSVSGTSEQLSEGRKKRHLSETAVGKRKTVLFKTVLFVKVYGLCRWAFVNEL